MAKSLTLVLGGARAGKSAFAERLAAQHKRALFVATAEARDEEMRERIARHKAARAKHWETLEEPVRVAAALTKRANAHDAVLLDCLTLWVSNLLTTEPPSSPEAIAAETQGLLDAYDRGTASWIVVSNEVGLGVVPPSELGRLYRDALGKVNQRFAARADKVYLLVAGLALDLKALGAKPWEQIPST
ncbi:MAG: bifunctional adenosylcobinamide kinase/adenosylcobinamide-phosphate guanylyltransferase [Chloroflexi bacterium]|nr:bifunctional adenosylcobinamide kinase/adenosylcobinamide-phosphate guanylyltransferase [Chloroflexota bacterium]